jgi:hypothetical protein
MIGTKVAARTLIVLVTLLPTLRLAAEETRPSPQTPASERPSASAEQACRQRLEPRRVPLWAQPGRFRYARWDGGILEVVKGFLSGWPGWREPDQILAVANWYEPRNVELVKMAGVNWIWVTFSNGFSLPSERPHQLRLAEFIAACRREGIHTTAYMSISNMFPDDMFRRRNQGQRIGGWPTQCSRGC